MEKIKELIKNPLVVGGIGLILGIIIGLPIMGWGLWPVTWVDADPSFLRADYQTDYLCMVIDSYARNQRSDIAMQRYDALGEKGTTVLIDLLPENCGFSSSDSINAFRTLVNQPGIPRPGEETSVTAVPTTAGAAGETPAPGLPTATTGTDTEKKSNPVLLLIVLCVVTLLVGGAAAYFFLFRNKRGTGGGKRSAASAALRENREATRTDFAAAGQEPPVSQFMTTYMLGDDLYDDSFSIDAPNGDFLGECGVGISDLIGVGDPKKVTAFEVWLFDKNDIQTVTKMLMSSHAYNDPAIRQRLMSKGELVLIEPGQTVTLETATLQMQARVVDASYGQGALPAESFFDRLTLELDVWTK